MVKHQYGLAMKLNLFNAKAHIWRAQALLNIGMREEVCQELLTVIQFDPKNEELRRN